MKVIVGLDPGLTTGVAIFDLSGNLIKVYSKKGMGKAEIVKFILSEGVPIIITTDRSEPPKMLEEIASALSSEVFTPKENLTVKEKKELTKGFTVKNDHERDAVASAMYFFKKNQRKLREIERISEEMGLIAHKEKIKELVLLGKARNLNHALEIIFGEETKKRIVEKFKEKKDSEKVKRRTSKKDKKCEEKLKKLERSYEIAKEYIEKLEKKLKDLEEQKRQLMEERMIENREIKEEIIKNKEIELRDNIIKNLRRELEKEREIRRQLESKLEIMEEEKYLEAHELIPIIKIERFNRESITETKEKYRIYNRGLFFEGLCRGTSTVKYLITLRPKFVVGEFGEEEKQILEENGIPVIEKREIKEHIVELKNFYGIEKGILEEILKRERKKTFLEWLDSYKKRFL